jgi:hypothetical protein
MATDTETQQAPGQETPPTAAQLYKYATWIHLGLGAEDCEALERGEDGEVVSAAACGDRSHFHAWCRLPNQVQHEDIRTKATAAKARHVRLLRDDESDQAVVLDSELDEIRAFAAADEAGAKAAVVDEILGKEFWKSYTEAMRDVVDQVGDDGETKPFEHIEEDQRRFNDLRAMSDEERAGDQAEFDELVQHLARFTDAVNKRHDELRTPEREALLERDLEDLLAMIRNDRVQAAGEKVFMSTYSRWEWLACTLTRPGGEQRFADMAALTQAAPEVLDVLDDTFNDLEQTKNATVLGSLGNG